MERGGVLSVHPGTRRRDQRRECCRAVALLPGPYVRLSVSDTGSGIPPGVLERMFDPFFTTKGVGQGTGLGLSLVHGIVTDLGGAIDVATQAGKGRRFDIWLPVAAERREEPAKTAPERCRRVSGEAVMIVDDERPLVTLAEEMHGRARL